jgi:hypothetical protein
LLHDRANLLAPKTRALTGHEAIDLNGLELVDESEISCSGCPKRCSPAAEDGQGGLLSRRGLVLTNSRGLVHRTDAWPQIRYPVPNALLLVRGNSGRELEVVKGPFAQDREKGGGR